MAYIGRQNLGGAYRQLDDISSGFDGSDTTHTMQVNSQNVTVGDVNQIILSLGGVIQKPGTDFTVSGSVLTFTTAPAANTSFFAILLGSDNGGTVTPTDGSVTASKIASSLGGDIVFNEDSNDHDFRIEGNGDANAFFLDAGTDRVYLGHNTNTSLNNCDSRLQIVGTDFDKAAISMTRYSDDANGPTLVFGKSRNASIDGNTIVQEDDELGKIRFCGADGTDFGNTAIEISGFCDGTPGSNDMPGGLKFSTAADGATGVTERMRIESDGSVAIGTTTTASMLNVTQASTGANMANIVSNSSYGNHMFYMSNASAGTTTFNFVICYSGTTSDVELRIKGNGAVTSDSAYSSTGGDYAEMFEWKDGNSSSEDRAGYSVVLDGEKIVKATDSDDASKIVGVVSGNPSVIGDADADKWNKKYLRDDFNRFIMEEYTVTTWTETTYDDGGSASPTENISYHTDRIPSDVTVPTEDVKDSEGRVIKTKAVVVTTVDNSVTKLTRKKLNPDWDSTKTYIPREDRKEWDVVGLMGKLRMLKGQPTGTNWIKMRDISDTVEEWLVR
jgi:hypothetical protein